MSNNLIALRKLNGLSQKDMAKKLEISHHSYRNKENGTTEFTLSEAKKVSDIFGLTIENIFFIPLDNKLKS